MPKPIADMTLISASRKSESSVCRDPIRSSQIAKRVFDVSVVTTALILFIPLIVTICVLMLLTQGRPILFRHNRIGKNGRNFPCLKFRTMAVNADELLAKHLNVSVEASHEWNTTRKLKSDPRVTPLGRVLRKSSVDELPQLLNVLWGDMSLVGPRPIVMDEVSYYGSSIHHYHQVRPGLTGAWQISGRNDVSYSQRVEMDVDYVKTQSFSKDIKILAKTVPAVLASRGSY
ncbi:sugar transferase [Lichenihabitans psoromatis]|uniref:sugar transferase n=1 Tax=Lichenihabitans psoromatis TaxID=2528642 RepID=UPI001FDEFA59|nr:sugar transferase [Lichenihabitans psoromatis]